jgi:uncharacterized Zn finger protein (UPF0148 family)
MTYFRTNISLRQKITSLLIAFSLTVMCFGCKQPDAEAIMAKTGDVLNPQGREREVKIAKDASAAAANALETAARANKMAQENLKSSQETRDETAKTLAEAKKTLAEANKKLADAEKLPITPSSPPTQPEISPAPGTSP